MTDSVLREHVHAYYAGHSIKETIWTVGPAADVLPSLRVAVIAPGQRTGLWVYVSLGASEVQRDPRIEFVLTAPADDLRHVEIVTMAAYYHQTTGLGCGHTVPIGEPWLTGSALDHLLVCKPYPFGPELEICDSDDRHVHFLWLLPITKAERDFKVEHGLEALETRFDGCAIEYWAPDRRSVVPQ